MKTLALIGANGMLATAIKKVLPDGFELKCLDLPEFDITDPDQVLALAKSRPQVIINCAAMTHVDGCETNAELAMQVNGEGPGYLAEAAIASGAVLVHISTDFVFDGQKSTPYREEDLPRPVSVYGASKRLGEERILASGLHTYFILRTSWLYGAGGNNFVETILRLASERDELRIVADQLGTPTWTEDLAAAVFALLQTHDYGLYHYSNAGSCSWYEFACAIVAQGKAQGQPLKVKEIVPIPTEAFPLPAKRPGYSVLSKDKIIAAAGVGIPQWSESLQRYFLQKTKG